MQFLSISRDTGDTSLFSITDKEFEFFMQLEQVRSQTTNLHCLRKSGTAMIEEAMEEIKDDNSPELKVTRICVIEIQNS